MGTASGNYRFTAGHPIERVGRRNRPSTDALGALTAWRDKAPGRSFEVLQDADDFIVVRVSFDDADDQAVDLHDFARAFGLVLQVEVPAAR